MPARDVDGLCIVCLCVRVCVATNQYNRRGGDPLENKIISSVPSAIGAKGDTGVMFIFRGGVATLTPVQETEGVVLFSLQQATAVPTTAAAVPARPHPPMSKATDLHSRRSKLQI